MALFKFRRIAAKKFNDVEVKRLIRNAVFRVGRGVKRDFESTVKTWKTPPVFTLTTSVTQTGPSFEVKTNDQTYRWVNDGTHSHKIVAKNVGNLAFPSDFNPKTSKGVIGSKSGGKSGPYFFSPIVVNPGIEARDFEKTIHDKWKDRLKEEINAAIEEGLALSGHKI
jgi:hypothetical protein